MSYQHTTGLTPQNGVLQVSLLEPASWRPMGAGDDNRKMSALFFGDDRVGPFAALNYVGPSDERYAPAPGHGHYSDSWRISIAGDLRVGAQSYAPGGFRFQEGSVLYGADDSGWGRDGAQSFVMMADRRGSTAIPANPADADRFIAAAQAFDKWLDEAPPRTHNDDCVPGIATTFGAPRFGRVDGSFTDSDDWSEWSPGVRTELGLCGDRVNGPVVVLVAAEPGQKAFPALRLNTEVTHIIVNGSAKYSDDALAKADVHMVEADIDGRSIVAEGDGAVWLSTVIGDRRALDDASCDDAEWLEKLRETVRSLSATLN